MEWLWDNYPNDIRFHTMIFEADNVLDPKVIRAMYSVRKRVSEAVTGRRFNGNSFGLSFVSKNGLRFHFDSETCLNHLFLNVF